MNPWIWLMLPSVGAAIGYCTNWVAVRMLFWPKEPICGVQGLLPKRQQDFADTVATVVADELVAIDELLARVDDVDLRGEVGRLFDRLAERKLAKLRDMAFVGELITDEKVAGWKAELLDEVDAHRDEILDRIKDLARERIDVHDLAFGKIGGNNIERLEQVVKTIARKEFRAIELWGAFLGCLIGLAQAGIVQAFAG